MRHWFGEGRGFFVMLLVFIVLMAVADMVTPDRVIRLVPFTRLAPFIASALLGFRETVVASALTLGLISLDYSFVTNVTGAQQIVIISSSAAVCVLSLAVCRVRLEREERIKRLRLTGEAAQRLLLRELPLRTDDVVVDGFYVAAEGEALVGGDIYEVLSTPYGTRLVLGDVRGKGLPAIGASAAVLTAFREGAYQEPSLETVVERMEQGILRYEDVVDSDAGERFVTALVLETAGPKAFRVIDCGHVPPFVIADGEVVEVWIDEPGLPLGLGDLADEPRRLQEIKVAAGGRVLTCTDGVSEARNPDGEYYPLADRLRGWLNLPTSQLLERLRVDLEDHTGGFLSDDAALLVLQR